MDEQKLKQQDESEIKLYNNFKFYKKSNSANTNYLQSKLDSVLVIKITKEEEKYQYLIDKIKEHEHFVGFFQKLNSFK